MRRFEHHNEEIQWLERLDGDEDGSLPAQGFVFRAKIIGRDYAIKIVRECQWENLSPIYHLTICVFKFKFYDPRRVQRSWGPLIGNEIPLETIAYYCDPFYNECRAYGRIYDAVKRKKLESHVIIPCHGFMFLSERDKQILEGRGMDLQMDQVPRGYQQSTVGGCSARAVVKDLASEKSGVDETTIGNILGDILMLNWQGIYNMDIRLDNFRDGKLVDFGSSRTDPHIFLQNTDDQSADVDSVADRTMFEDMIEEHKIPILKGKGKVHKGMVHNMELRRRRKRWYF